MNGKKHQYGKKPVKNFEYYWNKIVLAFFTPKTRWVKNTSEISTKKGRKKITVETGLNRRERKLLAKGILEKQL